jgi:PAS domain-containing protein
VTEEALQEGAQGCLIKGQIDAPGLFRALRHAIDRKFMEEALFEQKERAQVTLDSIGDAVICTDIEGNITFLNVVAETMTGWPRQEAAGRPVAEVLQIRDATTGQTTPNPMAMAIAHGRIPPPPSTIGPGSRPEQSSPSATGASAGRWRSGWPTPPSMIF